MIIPYVEGRSFKIRTERKDLRWILNKEDETGKPGRWNLRLQELELDVVHKVGIKIKRPTLYRDLGQ